MKRTLLLIVLLGCSRERPITTDTVAPDVEPPTVTAAPEIEPEKIEPEKVQPVIGTPAPHPIVGRVVAMRMTSASARMAAAPGVRLATPGEIAFAFCKPVPGQCRVAPMWPTNPTGYYQGVVYGPRETLCNSGVRMLPHVITCMKDSNLLEDRTFWGVEPACVDQPVADRNGVKRRCCANDDQWAAWTGYPRCPTGRGIAKSDAHFVQTYR